MLVIKYIKLIFKNIWNAINLKICYNVEFF